MHAATAAPTAAVSPFAALAGKIDALDEERKEIKGKINAIEEKINAIEGKIEAADVAHDAAAAATLRTRRDKLEDDMKQLRSLLLALQHKENLLLEAQQRAQQSSSSSGQFARHRMQVTADAYVHSLTLAFVSGWCGNVFVAYQRSTPAYCAPCSRRNEP
jgi:chromosome segregation ATPase